MPSKPEIHLWDSSDSNWSHEACYTLGFVKVEDAALFNLWLSTHGWPLFQSYYELETKKKEVSE